MKILVIVEREAVGSEVCWITDAMDEWTLDDAGVPADVKEKLKSVNVRQAWIEVPDNFFEKVWEVPTITATTEPAPAAKPGPWTSHGHPIPGVTVAGPRPAGLFAARCGGPTICQQCAREAGLHRG